MRDCAAALSPGTAAVAWPQGLALSNPDFAQVGADGKPGGWSLSTGYVSPVPAVTVSRWRRSARPRYRTGRTSRCESQGDQRMQTVRYEEMLPRELAAARAAVPLVYFPVGSLEYHGFHLPFGFDTMHAHAYCLAAAGRTGGVVLPPTYWGFRGHEGFPGSLLVSEETVARLAADVFRLLTAQQFRLVVAFSGHWPDVQGRRLQEVAQEHMAAHPEVRILVPDLFALHPTDRQPEHAGRIETSALLHLRPELVAMERLSEPGALHAIGADAVEATAAAGRERFATCVAELVRLVQKGLQGL